jgi:hypothetical protein
LFPGSVGPDAPKNSVGNSVHTLTPQGGLPVASGGPAGLSSTMVIKKSKKWFFEGRNALPRQNKL